MSTFAGTDLVAGLGLPTGETSATPSSAARFSDGKAWHIEIPSVEGPAAFRAVIDAADTLDVPIHRISQGSGIMMLTDAELDEMIGLGRDHDIEVCLFAGPRGSWDTGIQVASPGGGAVAGTLRGADQLAFAVEDIRRGCERGLRSILVADLGLLWTVGRLRSEGALPPDLIMKVSVQLPVANPATARVLQDLGADTLNLPDDLGGSIRHYEIPELVRVAAPIHLKFTVRNSPGLYPSGAHLESTVIALAHERVRRARLGLDILARAHAHAAA